MSLPKNPLCHRIMLVSVFWKSVLRDVEDAMETLQVDTVDTRPIATFEP